MKRVASCIAAVLLLAPFGGSAQSVFPSDREKEVAALLDAEHVSAGTRTFLRSKMKSHSEDMKNLTVAVALLRFDRAKRFAQSIANQPRLDRASDKGTPDGVDLKPAFFSLQDTLKKNATELALAAEKQDVPAMSASMGRTLDTCMSCHALFLLPARARAADAGK